MEDWLVRQRSLIGDAATEKLENSSVLLFGLGGVGGYALEGILRAGVGKITVVDDDSFSKSNLNRQILALQDTVGCSKTETAAKRAAQINPAANINALSLLVTPENAAEIIEKAAPDFIIDAIDSITAKLAIIAAAKAASIPMITCMGTGNRLDPFRFKISDISETYGCPLARIIRRELKARGIFNVDALWSDEPSVKTGMRLPASISFVPAAAGIFLASHTVRKIIGGL